MGKAFVKFSENMDILPSVLVRSIIFVRSIISGKILWMWFLAHLGCGLMLGRLACSVRCKILLRDALEGILTIGF